MCQRSADVGFARIVDGNFEAIPLPFDGSEAAMASFCGDDDYVRITTKMTRLPSGVRERALTNAFGSDFELKPAVRASSVDLRAGDRILIVGYEGKGEDVTPTFDLWELADR